MCQFRALIRQQTDYPRVRKNRRRQQLIYADMTKQSENFEERDNHSIRSYIFIHHPSRLDTCQLRGRDDQGTGWPFDTQPSKSAGDNRGVKGRKQSKAESKTIAGLRCVYSSSLITRINIEWKPSSVKTKYIHVLCVLLAIRPPQPLQEPKAPPTRGRVSCPRCLILSFASTTPHQNQLSRNQVATSIPVRPPPDENKEPTRSLSVDSGCCLTRNPHAASAMDFLKSAVASAIAKGPPFPYTFGDKIDIDESVFSLHNGTKRV